MTPVLWFLVILSAFGVRDGILIMRTYKTMGLIVLTLSLTMIIYIFAEAYHLVNFL